MSMPTPGEVLLAMAKGGEPTACRVLGEEALLDVREQLYEQLRLWARADAQGRDLRPAHDRLAGRLERVMAILGLSAQETGVEGAGAYPVAEAGR